LVQWDLEESVEQRALLEEAGDELMSEESVWEHALVHLDKDLASLRESIEQYYIQYAGQGLIEEELNLRASGGDWQRVKPMNARG
jgi:hypothetical protein